MLFQQVGVIVFILQLPTLTFSSLMASLDNFNLMQIISSIVTLKLKKIVQSVDEVELDLLLDLCS